MTLDKDIAAKVGDNVFKMIRSATDQVTRAGIASELEELMRKHEIKAPVVIVTEVPKVRDAWVRLVRLPQGQRLYRFLPLIVDFNTYEAMMAGTDIREWIVVFDDMGSGSEAYARYNVRMRRTVTDQPKLCMLVSKPQIPTDYEELVAFAVSLKPQPRVVTESHSFKLHPHQEQMLASLKERVTADQPVVPKRDYPEAIIRTKHTRLHADQGDGIVVTVVLSQLGEPGLEKGYYSRWPKYAIVGDRVFLRLHSREDVVDRLFPRVTAAYQYKLLDAAATEEARGDVKELLQALVYPDVQ